jgi:hypothetical protein
MLPRKLSQAPSRKVCKLESESLCVAIYSISPLIINCFSVGKDSFNIPEIVLRAVAENGSFGFAKGRLVCRAKPNVPFVRLAKIELKKMCGGENKKYRRVGNECRLSCCPVAIWSVCRWSPVKISVSFYVYSRPFSRCCVVC